MDSSSSMSTFYQSTIFTPSLNNYTNIKDLHVRLHVVRVLKWKLSQEASRLAAQLEPFPISIMFLNDTIQSLTEEEVAIVENIIKSRALVTHMGNTGAKTLHGRHDASSSRHNAAPSTGFILFGTNIIDPERHRATEVTMNLNKRKRDFVELGLPPTFAGMPTLPIEIPQRVSSYSLPLGLSAKRTSRLFRSSQGEPSTVITTSRHLVAPTPARVLLDRGKQPIGHASGSAYVCAQHEPNPRFPQFLLDLINRGF